MYKDIVTQLVKQKSVTEKDINEFITEYVKNKKKKDVTVEQLADIRQLLQMGVFNLNYAAREAARDLGLNITNVISKEGKLLNVLVD